MPETTTPSHDKFNSEESQSSKKITKELEPPVNEKTIEQKIMESWNKRDGEWSEVIDSEGHRVRINHY